ncbi:MAG: hypothetical protein V1703_01580 [Candidatus Altiarchaeota archaeon]
MRKTKQGSSSLLPAIRPKTEVTTLTPLEELKRIQELPVTVDLEAEPIMGFNGPVFRTKAEGTFGEIEIVFMKDDKNKEESLTFIWSPQRGRKTGPHLIVHHYLTQREIDIARMDVSDKMIASLTCYIEGEKKVNPRETYKLLMATLVPKMVYQKPEGDVARRIKLYIKDGFEDPAKTFKKLKKSALEQVTPVETYEALPLAKRLPQPKP